MSTAEAEKAGSRPDRGPGAAPGASPSFEEAVRVWWRIGFLSFGGPAGQIALMHRVLVEEKGWIDEARFLHALNFCMLLPGPEAQQLATYVGWLLHGTRGGLVAGTLFVLPGFVVITVLSIAYALAQGTGVIETLFFGLKAAVLAIVVQAVLKIGRRALKGPGMVAVAATAFVAIFFLGVPFPLIVLGAGVAGLVGARLRRDAAAATSAVPEPDRSPARPEGSRAGALKVAVLGAALWAAPVLLLTAVFGRDSVFPEIGELFAKLAVTTFGGAYAVLAYVAQEAVGGLGWLAPGEMLDGLAMAETTPGPLILVLTFVGFLAAFRDASGLPPLAGGLLGAALATWVTFVPCFLWIFLGAPHVERLRGHRALSAALATITAAVVGVILNLAVWFSLHALFREVGEAAIGPLALPVPDPSSLDPGALVLSVLALVLTFRLKLGMAAVLAACAAGGVALRLAL